MIVKYVSYAMLVVADVKANINVLTVRLVLSLIWAIIILLLLMFALMCVRPVKLMKQMEKVANNATLFAIYAR